MHELSLAAAILEVALGSAPGRRIAAVGVRVGHLRQVVPSALEFGFQLLAEGTLASGATLAMEAVAVAGVCRACGEEGELREFPLRCAACGGLELVVVRGEELAVEWVEVEEGDAAEGCGEAAGSGGVSQWALTPQPPRGRGGWGVNGRERERERERWKGKG